jgi:hypothetical protein
MKIQAIRHPSGARVFVGTLAKGQSPKAEFTRKIASKLSVGETSAREVLTQGKTRKGWKLETMQRKRLPMVLTYSLTNAGLEYVKRYALGVESGAFGAVLCGIAELCKAGKNPEATSVSEIMLQSGFTKHGRQRVTIDAARARDKGLLVINRQANKI